MTTYSITPPSGPISASARPPGSKSHTIRALFLAACADGTSTITGALDSADTSHARGCLRSLGIEISDEGEPWMVKGRGGAFDPPRSPLDAGESGLTARFLLALSALVGGEVTIVGQGRLPHRPMSGLIEALQGLGVDVGVDYPWSVSGKGFLGGGEVNVDATASSQVVSALLQVAPLARRPVLLDVSGVASSSYLDITVELMRKFGVSPGRELNKWAVPASGYRPAHVSIPMDASAMVYPAAAAAVTGGVVEIHGNPGTHPDVAFLKALELMGCAVDRDNDTTTVRGPETLRGIAIDMSAAPDAAVALATLCSVAGDESRIDGLGTLRLKESDRLTALQTELSKIGEGPESRAC